MNWSFQLYSARKFLPWDRILKLVADAGYSQVEGFGGVYDDPAGFRAEMDKNGLAMPTGHFSVDMLENDFDGARRIADMLGVSLMIAPYLDASQRPTDMSGWRGFGERLAAIGDRAKAAGFGFAWHNHDFEFKPLADGSVPMEHILSAAPDLGWEIDIAWVVRGDSDAQAWIDRHGRRIAAVHVKDIAKAGEGGDEDGWADVGHGVIDWPKLFTALKSKTPAEYYVMEQDNPNDIERFARRSIDSAKAW
jgi:sugar phosphate isomerase/epimerase